MHCSLKSYLLLCVPASFNALFHALKIGSQYFIFYPAFPSVQRGAGGFQSVLYLPSQPQNKPHRHKLPGVTRQNQGWEIIDVNRYITLKLFTHKIKLREWRKCTDESTGQENEVLASGLALPLSLDQNQNNNERKQVERNCFSGERKKRSAARVERICTIQARSTAGEERNDHETT